MAFLSKSNTLNESLSYHHLSCRCSSFWLPASEGERSLRRIEINRMCLRFANWHWNWQCPLDTEMNIKMSKCHAPYPRRTDDPPHAGRPAAGRSLDRCRSLRMSRTFYPKLDQFWCGWSSGWSERIVQKKASRSGQRNNRSREFV